MARQVSSPSPPFFPRFSCPSPFVMKKLLLPLMALYLAAPCAIAALRINEVHFNVEGPDSNFEFIELKSTTNGVESLAGLTLVIINNALSDDGVRLNPGEIQEVLDLSELSTGTNGLLLLGNGYTDSPAGGPWAGAIDPATAVGDPTGLGDSDIKTNTGLTIFLVRNYNTAAGPKGTDIDKDPFTGIGSSPISTGNGVIDWKQNPLPAGAVPQLWADADVIDSIGTLDFIDNNDAVDIAAGGSREPYVTLAANINRTWSSSLLALRDPDTFARQLGNDSPNNAASYYGGKMNNTNPVPTDILYRTNRIFGPANMLGQVTPGRANLATSLLATDFRINEVGLNPSGSLNPADRFQFIEIINNDGQSRSLSGYWLILLDSYDGSGDTNDNSPGVGGILEEWNLSDFATGPNGLLLLGDGFTSTYTPFEDAVSPQTSIADPAARNTAPVSSGWGSGDLRFKDGFTLLLVKGYTPPTTRDFDASPQDGVLDGIIPATSISDQIGFTQVAKTTIGRTYSTVNLRTVMAPTAIPDSFSRKPSNLANNSALAWYGGSYPSDASPMTLGFQDSAVATPGDTFAPTWFGSFRGAATPGAANLSAPINPVAPPIASSVRINEVMVNPTDLAGPGNDANNEYIELASTNQGIAYLDGLYVLVVDMNGTVGSISTGFPLNGYTTGTNGLVLLGDGYDNTNGPYGASEGTLPPGTAAFDPPVGLEGNELPNNGIAILVVRGVKGPLTLAANGSVIGDLDPENDGTLLAPADYTDELLDSIVINTINPGLGYGWINSTPFSPHHAARYPGNLTASSAASFYYGQVVQTPAFSPFTGYVGSFSGVFEGAASPGRANHGATPGPVSVGDVVFNEININPAGADNNFEFVELLAVNGASRSLNGYSILAIDNVVNNTGTVRHAWDLDGMVTGTNGLFLMGNRYPLAGQNPWEGVMRPQTRTGDPAGREGLASSFSDNVIGADSDNTNVTLLLVRNFNSFIDDDLDNKTPVRPVTNPPTPVAADYDSPGDGVFDSAPWLGVHDSFLLRSYAPTTPPPAIPGPTYPYNGWTYGLPNLTGTFFPVPAVTFYHPDTIARFRGENTPNDPNVWYAGDLRGGLTGTSGTAEEYATTAQDPTHPPVPIGFLGRLTPGQPNLIRAANADPDNDSIPNLVEQALNSDPSNGSPTGPLPTPVTIVEGGNTYLGLAYPRIRSGTLPSPVPYAAEAYTYVLETSPDLLTWTPDSGPAGTALIPVGTPTPNPDGVTETATVRLPTPVTAPGGRNYIRLRINRR